MRASDYACNQITCLHKAWDTLTAAWAPQIAICIWIHIAYACLWFYQDIYPAPVYAKEYRTTTQEIAQPPFAQIWKSVRWCSVFSSTLLLPVSMMRHPVPCPTAMHTSCTCVWSLPTGVVAACVDGA